MGGDCFSRGDEVSGIKDAGFSRPHFDGATYNHQRDYARLNAQCRRVAEKMADGQPHTLRELSAKTGDPEASVSARLRDLRKAGFNIEREYVAAGQWKYRMGRVI